MEEKLIIRISNNIGNQLFMYASAYAFSKKLKRELFIDKTSSYISRKNIYTYALDGLNLSAKESFDSDIFKGFSGYFKRKILKKFDLFTNKKRFLLEVYTNNKNTSFNKDLLSKNYMNSIYMEGYFESEKYFIDYKKDILNEFSHQKINNFKKNPFYESIIKSESVSLCIRQNRHSEKFRSIKGSDLDKSNLFLKEQINYIKNSIIYFKSKLTNPKFFLWSNTFNNLSNYIDEKNLVFVDNSSFASSVEKIHMDLFLMSNCKHFAVIPSAFNWWGCWLSPSKNKIVLRPKDNYFKHIEIKNSDYWPIDWISF